MNDKSVMDERKEYMEAHATGLGGTDIAAVTGMSPWKNALDVYLGKLGMSERGDMTEPMYWGQYQEEGIRAAYERRTGWRVLRPLEFKEMIPTNDWDSWMGGGSVNVMLRHPTVDCVVGSPDGLVPDAARGLEIKTAGFKTADWGKAGSDQIPTWYMLQVAQYMAITGLEQWDVACLFSGNRLEIFTVHRNRELEEQILTAAAWFWNTHIVPHVPPPIDGSESCSRWLAKKYGIGNQTFIEASDEAVAAAITLRTVQIANKQNELNERLTKNVLAEFIGENKGCIFPDGSRAQWIRPKPSQVTDWEALALSYKSAPKKIAKYTEEKPSTPYIRLYEASAKDKQLTTAKTKELKA